MARHAEYDVNEILDILNKTKSWRALDRHYNKAHNTVRNWLRFRSIEIIEEKTYRLKK